MKLHYLFQLAKATHLLAGTITRTLSALSSRRWNQPRRATRSSGQNGMWTIIPFRLMRWEAKSIVETLPHIRIMYWQYFHKMLPKLVTRSMVGLIQRIKKLHRLARVQSVMWRSRQNGRQRRITWPCRRTTEQSTAKQSHLIRMVLVQPCQPTSRRRAMISKVGTTTQVTMVARWLQSLRTRSATATSGQNGQQVHTM